MGRERSSIPCSRTWLGSGLGLGLGLGLGFGLGLGLGSGQVRVRVRPCSRTSSTTEAPRTKLT
eukprot:scaffold2490_cov54-Phaeocystis_antarctica.AAC.3